MYISFLTNKQLFKRLEKYVSDFHEEIKLISELTINTKIIIVDLDHYSDILKINEISKRNLIPTIFINAKETYSIFYNDRFPITTVFNFDAKIIEILKTVKLYMEFYYKVNMEKDFVEFIVKNRRVFVNSEEILYVKADRNKSYVKTKTEEFYCKNIRICDCKKVFGQNFCVCHKSYIVNKNNITKINLTQGTIILENNEEISIGRSYKHSLLEEIYGRI